MMPRTPRYPATQSFAGMTKVEMASVSFEIEELAQ